MTETEQAILAEKKRIENIIARDFHEHDDEEKNRNCEHNKALREILKKI